MSIHIKKKEKTVILMLTIPLLLVLLFISNAFAASLNKSNKIQQKKEELNRVSQKIEGLKNKLHQDKVHKNSLQHKLKRSEIAIGRVTNNLVDSHQNLTTQKLILKGLESKHQHQEKKLNTQQNLLGQQLRAVYMLGQHQYVKLLLNQHNPSTLSRQLQYYYYVNRARLKIIGELGKTLSSIMENERNIQEHTRTLQTLYQTQTEQEQKLKQHVKDRQHLLIQINARIKTKSQRLTQLQANAEVLKTLIRRLKEQALYLPRLAPPIIRMRGRLHWPVTGKITERFGDQIDNSTLTYRGVLISAPIGQTVRAIYPGKVVFANWLRGVGLLVIIQHNQGVMSLYGHDHTLLVKTGEYVKAGQGIATVGKTGGQQQSGLYFEIRDKLKPLNPRGWCA